MHPRGQMKQFMRDDSVTHHQLAPGTVRRILKFAGPYRRELGVFLGLVLVDAALGAAIPLLLARIIDDGVLGNNRGLVVALALVAVGIALASALTTLGQRWFSARIGEEPYLRPAHPGLRPRAAHAARVLHPDPDRRRWSAGSTATCIGAQQAFTSTLSSVVSNVSRARHRRSPRCSSCRGRSRWSLVLLPLFFLLPRQAVGRKLQRSPGSATTSTRR